MAPATKKKDTFVDDGRTVVPMDFDQYQTSGRVPKKPASFYRERQNDLAKTELTRKERFAMIKAIYGVLIPFAVILFAGIAIAMLIFTRFWEHI